MMGLPINTESMPGCVSVTLSDILENDRKREEWLADPRRPAFEAEVNAILARGNGYVMSFPDPTYDHGK